MSSIDLLPGLTESQVEFAYRYFPIFEDIKGAILTLAGLAMMQHGRVAEPGSELVQDGLRRVSQDLEKAARAWSLFLPLPAEHKDYQLVNENLHRLVVTARNYEIASLTGAPQDSAIDELLRVYTDLRRLSLKYWRLELVAESGHSH